MKRFVRMIAVLLILGSLCSVAAMAEEEATPWTSLIFEKAFANVYKNSSSEVCCRIEVSTYLQMAKLGVKTVKFQRSVNGTSWSTVKTYSASTTSGMTNTNAYSYTGTLSHTAFSGSYYRAYVVFYAYDGSTETTTSNYTASILF